MEMGTAGTRQAGMSFIWDGLQQKVSTLKQPKTLELPWPSSTFFERQGGGLLVGSPLVSGLTNGMRSTR